MLPSDFFHGKRIGPSNFYCHLYEKSSEEQATYLLEKEQTGLIDRIRKSQRKRHLKKWLLFTLDVHDFFV